MNQSRSPSIHRQAVSLANALHAERDMLFAIMENTRTHLAYLDHDFRFVKVNSAYAEGAGYRINELIGRNHFDLFPDAENLAIFEHVRNTGQRVEYRAKPYIYPDQPDRGVTYWDWTLAPVLDAQGQVRGLVFSLSDVTEQERSRDLLQAARDELQLRVEEATAELRGVVQSLRTEVSERRRAEQALRESEARLRMLVEQMPAILWTTDTDLRYTSMEGAGLAALGREPGELVGRSVAVTGPTDAPEVDAVRSVHRRALDGESVQFKGHWSGSSFEGFVEPLRDADGSIIGCIGVAVDISDRIRAEQAQREREQQYRSIFEATSDAMVITTIHGKIVDANPAACRMTGYGYEEFVALNAGKVVDGEHLPGQDDYLAAVHSGRRLQHKAIAVRKDGSEFDIEVHVGPLMVGGKPHVLSVIRDVTESVRAYQILEQRVAERTRELSALLRFSHEITSTLELQPRMERVVDGASRLIDNSAVGLVLFEDDTLQLCASRGLWSAEAAGLIDHALNRPVLRDLLISRTSALVIPDLNGDTHGAATIRTVVGPFLERVGAPRSILWVPFVAKEKVIGGLGIVHQEPDQYTDREASLAQAIANQASAAIENARLYAQANEWAVMRERQRLGRDLHDSVAQSLYSLVLMAEAARRQISAGNAERGIAYLTRIGSTSEQVLKELRLLVYELRPSMLERNGLIDALKQRLEAVEARAGVDTNFTVEGSIALPERIESELYRIAQEALNNSLKHSAATAVDVTLRAEPNQVILSVRDNGRGFPPQGLKVHGGLGLVSMQERAQRLGGSVMVVAQPGEGVAVTVTIPTNETGWN